MSVIIIFLESFLNFSAVFQVSAGGQAGGSIGEAIGWSRLPTATAD